ncbi:MAG: Recombinase [Bradyrhizobium sp.]|nr:Recombinase [Bradyrhizobium sp.]
MGNASRRLGQRSAGPCLNRANPRPLRQKLQRVPPALPIQLFRPRLQELSRPSRCSWRNDTMMKKAVHARFPMKQNPFLMRIRRRVMISAAIYARFSSDLQSDRSIEDQFAVCRDKAKRENIKTIAYYEDRAKSGASIHGRDGISKMMQAAKRGEFSILIVESLDRISRDQEDLAAIYKKLSFGGIDILTVHEGRADQVQIGLRGIVSAMYLTDLAHKVRRGAAGNIRQGKHAGGLAYGYRTTPGKPGEWVIHEPEAKIIRRIYAMYLAGARSGKIIGILNGEGVKPPRGTYWQPGTLTGSNNRHNGILGNEIYCGQLVWNRVRMVKNPETGKRVSRPNPESLWHRADARHLQILSPEIFNQVTDLRRQRGRAAPALRRKPRRLLSGLLRCSVCGGGMSIKGVDRGGTRVICTKFHNAKTCDNNRTYYLDQIEQMVLTGLRKHLVDPSAIRLFLETYHAERKRLIANANTMGPKLEKALGELNRKIARLTEAMIDSDAPISQFTAKISDLNAEKQKLEKQLLDLSPLATTVALHPAALERYLSVVGDLATTINAEEGWVGDMAEAIRQLIESVIIKKTLPGEPIRLKVNGRLAALIAEPIFPESSSSGVKLVAREGLEPPTPGL